MKTSEKRFWNWETVLSLVGLYALLLLRGGYVMGGSDHAETLSYAKFLNNNQLFINDLYIKNLSATDWNERFLFSKLMSFLLRTHVEYWILAVHVLISLVILGGGLRVAFFFQHSKKGAFLTLIFAFLLLQNVNLGGNNLYENILVPSLVAQAFCFWGFYFLLKNRLARAYTCATGATFFQPLVGLQFFIILFSIQLIINILQKNKIIHQLKYSLIWWFTAGVYVGILAVQNTHCGADTGGGTIFEILAFRAPHHYLPTHFGAKNWAILLPLLSFGAWFWWKRAIKIRLIFGIIGLGAIVYSIGVLWLKNETMMRFQWFGTTGWLLFFSSIGFMIWLQNFYIFQKIFHKIFKINYLHIYFSIIFIFSIFIFPNSTYPFFTSKTYDFPNAEKNSEIDIAKKAKLLTPPNAVFIVPIRSTYFRFYAERSIYVDFKSIAHNCDGLRTWRSRISEIYGTNNEKSGFEFGHWADEQMNQKTDSFFEDLAKKTTITHVLAHRKQALNFEKIIENQDFTIYKLK